MSDAAPPLDPKVPPPITTASYPFNKANADIILRTPDHVDFHVYSQILIAASPFFEGMFDVPQPPLDQQELKYGRPIINVTENSKALDPLLRICYPINKPKKLTAGEIEVALAAAMKFEMELAITVLTENLRTLAKSSPLEAWGIALTSRCWETWGITAGDYFRLREFVRTLGRVPPDFKFLSSSSFPKVVQSPPSEIASLSLPDAPPPDVICRSTNDIEFRAHKAVLSVASTTLQRKVCSPTLEEGPSGDHILPVIQFEEEGNVLHIMLQPSYRCATDVPLPSDLADVTAILAALEKYGLHSAQPFVWSFWQRMAFASPLRAYCLAIRVGHVLGAKEAARLVLNRVIDDIYIQELEHIPALAYHRLLNYYEKCRTVKKHELTKLADSLNTSPSPAGKDGKVPVPEHLLRKTTKNKRMKARSSSISPIPIGPPPDAPWLLRYLRDLPSRLQSPPGSVMPNLSDLLNETIKATSQDSDSDPGAWCEECQILAEGILKVNKALQRLSDDLSKVELEI
ncbi:hypothetical protein V8D89_016031 [Ganoderma adspersum]